MSQAEESRDLDPELQQKWEQLFDAMDVDEDEYLTKKDLDIIQENIMKCAEMSPERRMQACSVYHDMWVQWLDPELTRSLTLSQFISEIKQQFDAGKLTEKIVEIRSKMFDCIDQDDDGKIEYKDFKIFSAVTGQPALPYIKKAFKAIDAEGNGTISKQEYIEAYVTYCMDANTDILNLPLFGMPRNFCDCTGAFMPPS